MDEWARWDTSAILNWKIPIQQALSRSHNSQLRKSKIEFDEVKP